MAGVSKEATSMALRLLTKTGRVRVEAKRAFLTPNGREALEAARSLYAELERAWDVQFGAATSRACGRPCSGSSISATESERDCRSGWSRLPAVGAPRSRTPHGRKR